MEFSLLTPLGALIGLAVLVPLAVVRDRDRRVRRVRAALRLPEPSRGSQLWVPGALIALCGLVALAAAQPVVATNRALPERTDAQVFMALDTSRSMLASSAPGTPTRFDRARVLARDLAEGLPEIPVGVASMTDRLLPHLFPTTDRRVLAATMEKTLSVESPGPSSFYSARATTFDALKAAATLNYFPPAVTKRVFVVFTDGETRPLEEDLAAAFSRKPKVETIFVRLWSQDERIFQTGVAEVGYEPDSASQSALSQVASSVGGRVVEEEATSAPELAGMVEDLVGSGPTIDREHEGRRRALMPWITLLAFVPLAYLLARRNL